MFATAGTSIPAIAQNTIKGAIHERLLYVLLMFGLGLVLLSTALSALTVGFRLRIVTDVSLSSVNFAGIAIGALLGTSSIARDSDRKLSYYVLSKPTGRASYVIGKSLGVLATTSITVALMTALATLAVAYYSSTEPGGRLFEWVDYSLVFLLLLVRVSLVSTVAVGMGALVSSTVALIATTGFAVGGYLSSDLRFLLGQSDSASLRGLGNFLYYTLPDLSLLDPLGRLIHGHAILTSQVVWGIGYALAYEGAFLILVTAVFSRRDLL